VHTITKQQTTFACRQIERHHTADHRYALHALADVLASKCHLLAALAVAVGVATASAPGLLLLLLLLSAVYDDTDMHDTYRLRQTQTTQ
jgi:hypothetical protein